MTSKHNLEESMLKKVAIVIVVLALTVSGWFTYTRFSAAKAAQVATASVETAPVERGNLTVTISAIGTVRTNQSASLSWQTSGTVESVNAVEGQAVKDGDMLAQLQQTSLDQDVILAKADLASAQQALEDLYTEAESSKVQAMADIVTYEEAVRDAQYTLDNFSIPSNMSDMDAVQGVAAMKETLDAARIAFEPYKYLSSGNATRKDLLEIYNEAQADYNTSINRLQYEYDLEVAQANLDKARADYEKWKNGPQASDIDSAKAKVAAAEATLALAWIEAPFDGVITLAEPKVGDQVSSGTLAFQIDDMTSMFVDVDVSEIDINQVAVGQDAVVVFDAIPDKEYHGQVAKVALSGEENSDVVNYPVTVQVLDADGAVRSGMTAQVDITVAEKENVLLVPNQAIQVVDNQIVVDVMNDGQPRTQVTLTLGVANDTYTEVLEGDLQEGDLVVLNASEATISDNMRDMMIIGGGPGGPPPENQQAPAP
jgi:HlyD family secretion protein